MSADADKTALSDERLAMLAALVNGDVSLAYRLATELLAHGVGFDEIVGDVFGPVQTELGARPWAAGDIVVADEHAASAAVEDLIIRLGATVEAPTGPAVVVAAAERDTHALGARWFASLLSLDGFRVLFLGASVPAEDLRDYLEAQQPLGSLSSRSIGAAISARGDALLLRTMSESRSSVVVVRLVSRGAGVRCGRIPRARRKTRSTASGCGRSRHPRHSPRDRRRYRSSGHSRIAVTASS